MPKFPPPRPHVQRSQRPYGHHTWTLPHWRSVNSTVGARPHRTQNQSAVSTPTSGEIKATLLEKVENRIPVLSTRPHKVAVTIAVPAARRFGPASGRQRSPALLALRQNPAGAPWKRRQRSSGHRKNQQRDIQTWCEKSVCASNRKSLLITISEKCVFPIESHYKPLSVSCMPFT
jgi:hypothetical protein